MTPRDHHTSTTSAAAAWERNRTPRDGRDWSDVCADDLVQGRPFALDPSDPWAIALAASVADAKRLREIA